MIEFNSFCTYQSRRHPKPGDCGEIYDVLQPVDLLKLPPCLSDQPPCLSDSQYNLKEVWVVLRDLFPSARPNVEAIDVEPVESVEVEEPVDIGDSTADSDI